MKLLPSILTGALIASLIYNIFQYKISRETETALTNQLDSVHNRAKDLEIQQEIMNAHIFDLEERNAAQDLVIQSRERQVIEEHELKMNILRKYEKLNRMYLVSNAQRDSIRAVLYPPGHHF